MTSPHSDPASNGTRFGDVLVTIDLEAGDCVIIAPRPGPVIPVMRSTRYHSLDEIRGAYQAQMGRASADPTASDLARALKFAGQQLKSHEERNR